MENLWAMCVGAVSFALAAGSLNSAPEPGGKLKGPIVLREEQDGFAGKSVTEWKVEESGKWKVARFTVMDGKEMEGSRAEKSGKLSHEQLGKLTERFTKDHLSGLPAQLGTREKVNSHVYVLQFGDKKVTIAGVPPRIDEPIPANIQKAIPAADEKTAGHWKRAADAIQTLIEVTAADVN